MADTGKRTNTYDGLRSFLDLCDQHGEIVRLDDADWNLEIGTLTEAASEHIAEPPALLFDNITGYPKGFRVLSLMLGSTKRFALALGLPVELSTNELLRSAAAKLRDARPIPPVEVETGPVMENVLIGDRVDMLKFPSLRSHQGDGGRYIGTGDTLINRTADGAVINMGTYRQQVHGKTLLGLWMSPGQHGRVICQSWWDQGKACPVVATYGGDPLVFMTAHSRSPWGVFELDRAGGLRGQAVEVVKGPITGLPIPAHAEVAIEGEVPPPSEQSAAEGPFGEWPGYYSGGTLGTGENQPVIRVSALYHRNDPILVNMAPQWPGAPNVAVRMQSGLLWDQLEAAGVPDVTGVHVHNLFLMVVAIKQRYAGHARQAGMAVLGSASGAFLGRYVVVVDDDIDAGNIQEVLWAMETRVDPASDIQIVEGCWSTPLDPRMPPEQKAARVYTNSRAIFYAVRPYQWRDKFPMVNRAGRDAIAAVIEKYKHDFPVLGQ